MQCMQLTQKNPQKNNTIEFLGLFLFYNDEKKFDPLTNKYKN